MGTVESCEGASVDAGRRTEDVGLDAVGRLDWDDEGVIVVGERGFVEGAGIELGCTAHSGSSHFH